MKGLLSPTDSFYSTSGTRVDDEGRAMEYPNLMLTRGQDVTKETEGLLAILPVIQAAHAELGWKEPVQVGIFEQTLSENGIYRLDYHDDAHVDVVRKSWGRDTVLFSGDLFQALVYVARHNWYQED